MMETTFIDVNKKDEFGKTALHHAAEKNNLPKVQQLLFWGADVNANDGGNATPLHIAAYKNIGESHLKLAQLLLENSADVYAQECCGRTPIYYLMHGSNVKTIHLFLNFNASIDVFDKYGYNILFPAAGFNSNEEVVQLLIDFGLDPNHRAFTGSTPAHLAVSRADDNIKILKTFLKNGASMDVTNHKGFTPLIETMRGFVLNRGVNKKKSKKLGFVIEHTDFNATHNNVNPLNFNKKPLPKWIWSMILQHISKLESLGVPVHPNFLDTISEQDRYGNYYIECNEELLRARDTKFPDSWISFYDILIGGRKKLKNYAGNDPLVEDFKKSDWVKKFPIYGATMDENVKKGLKKRELFDKSSIVLSGGLPIFKPNHLIIRDILDCIISKKDLLKLCQ